MGAWFIAVGPQRASYSLRLFVKSE